MKLNSFNPYKALFHVHELEALSNNEIVTPLTVDLDLSNVCNQKCFFCNAAYVRCKSNYSMMSKTHAISIIDAMVTNWPTLKSMCFGGGGEPFTHPDAIKIIEYTKKNTDIEIAIFTNATLLTDNDCKILSNSARYVGISFDAATKETYQKIRGVDHFDRTLKNIEKLSKYVGTGTLTDVCVKVLVNHYNYDELLDIAKLCKKLGVSSMHIRPVGIDNVLDKHGNKIGENYNLKEYKEIILNQYEEIEKLKTDSFNPVIVKHMFGENMERIVTFNKCWITPLSNFVFSADGNGYLCINNRGNKNMLLGPHYPDPLNIMNLWGSEHHKTLLSNINPNSCMRCTHNFANEFIEKAILEDNMYKNFL